MGRSKTQYLIVKVGFDAPVTKAEAAREFRNCVYQTFYLDFTSPASIMKIRSAQPAPALSQARGEDQ